VIIPAEGSSTKTPPRSKITVWITTSPFFTQESLFSLVHNSS
jgi:hypothetical protein